MNTIEKNLREQIKAGRGQGHGADYQPWLQVSRRRSPSNGNINFRHLPILGRHSHFMSRNEWHIALWILWLGVEDLREQFPLWPFPHPHPLFGRAEVEQTRLPSSRGTLEIAKELGIDHGRIVGSNISLYLINRNKHSPVLCLIDPENSDQPCQGKNVWNQM